MQADINVIAAPFRTDFRDPAPERRRKTHSVHWERHRCLEKTSACAESTAKQLAITRMGDAGTSVLQAGKETARDWDRDREKGKTTG